MRREKNTNFNLIIIGTFLLCFVIRFAEVLMLRLDETLLNENFIHKLLGILILAFVIQFIHFTWKDIGFDFKRFYIPTLIGLGLGIGRFAIGYGLEYSILAAQGKNPSFRLFLSSFSLTGNQIELPMYCILLTCIFNIVNAIMEEGIFRGLFIKLAEKRYRFAKSNFVAALLFGIWHVAMPIRNWLDGTMTLRTMLLYSLGYIILSGSIGIMWGMLFKMSGVIWIGLADHFFNNTILNILHITTSSGTDELQMVRAMVAQFLALALVLIIYIKKDKKGYFV